MNVDALHQVLRVLLRKHGITPNGVKSNLYTSIGMIRISAIDASYAELCSGLDSKHPSGIQSTVSLSGSMPRAIPNADRRYVVLRFGRTQPSYPTPRSR